MTATAKPPIDTRLRRLRLGWMAQQVEAINAEALKQTFSYLEFLEALIDGELLARENKALAKRVKQACFPVIKSLAEFDFEFQPQLDAKLVKTLATGRFIEDHANVLLIGKPGTGKSHLAIGLGMRAIELGYTVRFTTIQDLAATLRASMADNSTEERIAEYIEPDLTVLDELGFTELDRALADAFYRIIASRYERKSIIVTSNKSFESWAEVFPDPVLASAVLDRLVHHAHLIPIVGDSYRTKDLKQKARDKTPLPPPADIEPPEPAKAPQKSKGGRPRST